MGETTIVIGSGAREFTIAREVTASPDVDQVFVWPGNAGTEMLDKVTNRPDGNVFDTVGITDLAKEHPDTLVIYGPEAPLVRGGADDLAKNGILVFGPSREAARLEGSKIFATEFFRRHDIPHPQTEIARNFAEAVRLLKGCRAEDIVIKADGLAGGKGAVLPDSEKELHQVLCDMLLHGKYDGAGESGILIQERVHGPEISVFVISDGENFSIVPFFAQDHKRLKDGDEGPNTGGMGAYTPVPEGMMQPWQLDRIQDSARKHIQGMAEEGRPYKGTLFMGMLLAEEYGGAPLLIEDNCRLGDPETQVVLPSLTRTGIDVHKMFRETAMGSVPDLGVPILAGHAALTVYLATEGYPEAPRKGAVIRGLDREYPNVTIEHGGTTRNVGGLIIASSGRAVSVTGHGSNLQEAREAAYSVVGKPDGVSFDGSQYRTDIGRRALPLRK